MHEIVSGVWHWSAFHEPIRTDVSSYYVEPHGLVVDPKIPEGGIEAAFAGRERPRQVVLTIGLHDRDAQAFADAFGIPIRAPREGLHRLEGVLDAEPYGDGDELVPGVRAVRIGVLCPDEYSLHVTGVANGALTVADGLVHYGEELGFVPDFLLGDDAEAIKAGLKERYAAQLDKEFDALLLAHGTPIAHDAKRRLRDFVL